MSSSSAYYSNEEATINREINIQTSDLTPVAQEKLDEVYEIERCLKYIKENDCHRVALQFPDSLLTDASNVAWQLENNCDARIYVLADTSFGHCDVDEVNAKHINADLIIHYGESALTQSATIPTLHVFGRHPSSIVASQVCDAFRKAFPGKNDTRVVFLHHVTCSYIADAISDELLMEYPYMSTGQLNIPKEPGSARPQSHEGEENVLKDLCTKSCPGCPCRLENKAIDKPEKSQTAPNERIEIDAKELGNVQIALNSNHSENQKLPISERNSQSSTERADLSENDMEIDSHTPDCKDLHVGFYTIPIEIDKMLSDYSIFYLGSQDAESLRQLMLSHPSCDVHVFDPSKGYRKMQSNTNRQLMKRYYLVEKAKDAKIVGILVGTMGVAGYLECLAHMKQVAKYAGKKTYTFIMGKLTPEKLANYLEVDIYVLVANPEHSILDVSNFYRPVITPYELEVACNPGREWTSNYITDFRRIIPGGSDYIELPADRSKAAEEADVSLITGNIRANTDIEDSLQIETSDAISLRNEKTDVAVFGANSSAQRLMERSWKGLEQKVGETPVTKAKEGRSGIPVSYNEMDF